MPRCTVCFSRCAFLQILDGFEFVDTPVYSSNEIRVFQRFGLPGISSQEELGGRVTMSTARISLRSFSQNGGRLPSACGKCERRGSAAACTGSAEQWPALRRDPSPVRPARAVACTDAPPRRRAAAPVGSRFPQLSTYGPEKLWKRFQFVARLLASQVKIDFGASAPDPPPRAADRRGK